MSKVIMIQTEKILAAWQHWAEFLNVKDSHWDWQTDKHWVEFTDFLDPVRQFSLDPFVDGSEVNHQVASRIELLAGPHWYAYLKANEDKIERAKTSWGKR